MNFESNITENIRSKIGKNLHKQQFHPIEIIKHLIYNYFGDNWEKFDDLPPDVSVEDNFDHLLIPKDHPARSKSDTYYQNENTVLRTHTSAHQHSLLTQGFTKFLVTGDVYRKDEIDNHHYPVFHQMEGVCVTNAHNVESELKLTLIGLVEYLFPDNEYRISDDYFPFTHPSFEIEVYFNDKWIEILGCGVVQRSILQNAGVNNYKAWAFGLGLERLAMILFSIPDIRYFWCGDEAFLSQFRSYSLVKFVPYSKLKPLTKDIAFWVNDICNGEWYKQNDFFELCRDFGMDMVKEVALFDIFVNPKNHKQSRAYHITYSCTNSKITNPSEFNRLVNEIHMKLSERVCEKLNLVLR